MSPHRQCEDCGKCREVGEENWCGSCEYWSCERGPDCGITHAAAPDNAWAEVLSTAHRVMIGKETLEWK